MSKGGAQATKKGVQQFYVFTRIGLSELHHIGTYNPKRGWAKRI
jgi:hypothetical protein